MLAKIYSAAVYGVDAYEVEIVLNRCHEDAPYPMKAGRPSGLMRSNDH